jgi:hypothetical protein
MTCFAVKSQLGLCLTLQRNFENSFDAKYFEVLDNTAQRKKKKKTQPLTVVIFKSG